MVPIVLGQQESNTQVLLVGGMTCSACAAAVEAALHAVPGVQQASVSLVTGRAEVRYDPEATGARHLVDAVRNAGFEVEVFGQQRLGLVDRNHEDTARWRRQLVLSALLTLPVFLVAMVLPLIHNTHWLYTTMVSFPILGAGA